MIFYVKITIFILLFEYDINMIILRILKTAVYIYSISEQIDTACRFSTRCFILKIQDTKFYFLIAESIIGSFILLSSERRITFDIISAVLGSSSINGRKILPLC